MKIFTTLIISIIGLTLSYFSVIFYPAGSASVYKTIAGNKTSELKYQHDNVLGASDILSSLNFNIPANFNNSVTIKDLTLEGQLNIKSSVKADGQTFDLGNGVLKASNIIYGIAAGDGLLVTEGQNPIISNTGVLSIGGETGEVTLEAGSGITIDGLKISADGFTPTAGSGISVDGKTITNDDKGSSQNIFKSFAVLSQNSINAGSNSDIFTFVAGSGVTLTTDSTAKSLTIASSNGGGGGVTSLNSLLGGLTLIGAGINNVSTVGSTITVTGTEADTLASVTSRGASTSSNVAFNGNVTVANVANGLVKGTNTGQLTTATPGVDYEVPITASNGITRTSNNIALGGSLNTDTTIDTNGNDVNIIGGGNIGIGTTATAEKLTVAGNIVPSTDLTYDLGSADYRWRHIYADNISSSGSASFSDVVIQGKTNQITDDTNLASGKDVFVYEVKKDADTGKWINSEKIQASSWYNETIDAEASACSLSANDRCGVRNFPQKAVIVVTNTQLYIYDAKDNTLWMKILVGSGYAIPSGAVLNAVYAFNGSLYVATTKGLIQFDFITDRIYKFDYNSGSGGRASYLGNISQRNTNKGYSSRVAWGQIASDQVNGVHGTLIGGKLFVAVSTVGGASVINISDQRVVRYINQ